MNVHSSTLGTAAFVKWQLPQEFDCPVPTARREQLKEEFKRHFGPEAAGRRAVNVEEKATKQPQTGAGNTAAHAEGKSSLKVALATRKLPELLEPKVGSEVRAHVLARAQQLAKNASPAELSVVRRALKLMPPAKAKDRTNFEEPATFGTERFAQIKTADNLPPVTSGNKPAAALKQPEQSSTSSQVDSRWQFTSWHGMKPQESERRNPKAASAQAAGPHGLQPAKTSGHYRIHPEWGWDAPPP